MKNHRIVFVEADELPEGTDWALVHQGEVDALYLRDGADLEVVLSEAWVAFHEAQKAARAEEPPVERIPFPREGLPRAWVAVALVAATAFPSWTTAKALAGLAG